jgi:hypothetical protein
MVVEEPYEVRIRVYVWLPFVKSGVTEMEALEYPDGMDFDSTSLPALVTDVPEILRSLRTEIETLLLKMPLFFLAVNITLFPSTTA